MHLPPFITRRRLFVHTAALPAAAIGASLGLVGCATVDKPRVQARLSGKSITVISTVGTTLRLSWRGTTVFNNEQGEAFVPGWGLKDQLENSTVELLQASGRFSSVQRVTITATRREDALKELRELKTPTDHVLLLSAAPASDSLWASREGFFGIGIAQRSIVRMSTESAAHVSLRADLLVPSTFGAVLGEATVNTAQRVPAPALLTGPRLNDSVAAAARESLQVQVDAALQSLVNQLGLGKATAPMTVPPPVRDAVAQPPAASPVSAEPVPAPSSVEGRGIPAPVGR